MTGGDTVEETMEKKKIATEVFNDAAFTIHKWHSNELKLEGDRGDPLDNGEETYAKQQLGGSEGKLLGLSWNRERDTLSVELRAADCSTKRTVFSELAKIYDPLGLTSPTTLVAKLLYRKICDAKISWDETLPKDILQEWKKWSESLQESFVVPVRSHLIGFRSQRYGSMRSEMLVPKECVQRFMRWSTNSKR